jgi:hypothetical protein
MRGDRLREACQPIAADNQHVLHAAVCQLGTDDIGAVNQALAGQF